MRKVPSPFGDLGPRAFACIELLMYLSEASTQQCGGSQPQVFAALHEGLELGIALSAMDPTWAQAAHTELVDAFTVDACTKEAEASGGSDDSRGHQYDTWKLAEAMLRRAAELGRP